MAGVGRKATSTRPNLQTQENAETVDEDFVICGACRKHEAPDKSPTIRWVECDACGDWYHQICVRYVFKTVAPNAGPDEFECTPCRRSKTAAATVTSELKSKIDEVKRHADGILTWAQEELTTLSDRLEATSETVNENCKSIKQLQQEGNPALSKRVLSVEEDIQRRDCLLIVTIARLPVVAGLNDIAIIEKIGSVLQVEVRRCDIARCWRARMSDPSKIPLLYCRFVDARARNEFFFSWMKHKDITLDKIAPNLPKTKIYIDPMLSSSAFKVKQKAKALLKEGKITSVYTLDGFVLVKRLGDSSGRRILSTADLDAFLVAGSNTAAITSSSTTSMRASHIDAGAVGSNRASTMRGRVDQVGGVRQLVDFQHALDQVREGRGPGNQRPNERSAPATAQLSQPAPDV
jgi:PHD-finger